MLPACSPVVPDTPEKENPDPQPDPDPEPEPETKDPDWMSYKKVDSFPVMRITAKGGISRDSYISGSMTLEDPEGMYWDKPSVSATLQIKGRGNTTWNNYPKKPYRIKLDEKTKMLGIKGNKDWVLLANYSDKSLMRNTIAMEISRICGLEWTPRCRAVELYLNGEYQGVYDLFQKVEVAGEKVDITPDDIFLEVDTTQDEPVSFMTDIYAVPVMFKEPTYPTAAQQAFVKDYFSKIEKAMSGSNFGDPDAGYAAYIDVDSFINFYIIQELTKNVDGALRKSTFLTLPAEGKLRVSCVWDFDLSLGNANYLSDKSLCNGKKGDNGPEGWWVRYYCRTGKNACWYSRMFEDPSFTAALKARWNELKPQLDKVPELMDLLYDLNGEAYARNFKTWAILGKNVGPNLVYPKTYKEELDYLKNFYNSRLAWMDTEINKF